MTLPPAIVEIAGRDSVAAAVVAVRERGLRALLPTIAHTPTEIGDRSAPLRALERLRGLVDAEVLEPVELSDDALWSALNARYTGELSRRFGVCSPCLGCHLYLHLMRVPLAWAHGNAPVVAGERDTHGGRLKLSQTPAAIDASAEVLAYAGIELLEPIRRLERGEEVEAIVGARWPEGGGQLGCALAGNYLALDGTVTFDEAGYERYLRGFFVPVGKAVVDAWRATERPDYDALVRSVLE